MNNSTQKGNRCHSDKICTEPRVYVKNYKTLIQKIEDLTMQRNFSYVDITYMLTFLKTLYIFMNI